MSVLAKLLIYGDAHVSDKGHGAHRDYPATSLGLFRNITAVAEEIGATHIIGLGDLTYGRFSHLDYRIAFEAELEKQFQLTNGNRFELRGNHDIANLTTEYDYYINRGLLKPSTNIQVGNLNLSMVDYGKFSTHEYLPIEDNKKNVVLFHDYIRFSDTKLSQYYGEGLDISRNPLCGVDIFIGGHIHKQEIFKGVIEDSSGLRASHEAIIQYLGCPCRPAYREGFMDTSGYYSVITVHGSGTVDVQVYEFALPPIEETFNLEKVVALKDAASSKKVDISDVAQKLDSIDRLTNDPEQYIMSLDVALPYRARAIEFFREAMS